MFNYQEADGPSGVGIHPKGDPGIAQQDMYTVYFIGWRLLRPILGAPKPVWEDDNQKVPKLDARGRPVYTQEIERWDTPTPVVQQRPYKMPKIGESIVVPELVWQQLEIRLRDAENNRYYPGVTLDASLALAVKEAFDRAGGDPRNMSPDLDLTSFHATVDISTLPVETLREELSRREAQEKARTELLKMAEEDATVADLPEDEEAVETIPARKSTTTRTTKKS